MVTVITVTYNSAKYVRDAIESVLAQDYNKIEYIIGDDCSFDNTWNIIQEYNDPRIRAYRNEKNIREYPNRNKAIAKANGKYLIFIDGDDIILQYGISFFVSMMEKFPTACMAIQKGYINNILFPALLSPNETITNHYFGRVNLLDSSFTSNFFRTDLLKICGQLREYLISGDEEVRVRLASLYPVLFLSGWVSWPRETPGQASSKITIDQRLGEVFTYTIQNLSKTEYISVDLKKEIEAKVKKTAAWYFLRSVFRGNFITAKKILQKTNISFWEMLKYFGYSTKTQDFMEKYTPANPFKRDFLK